MAANLMAAICASYECFASAFTISLRWTLPLSSSGSKGCVPSSGTQSAMSTATSNLRFNCVMYALQVEENAELYRLLLSLTYGSQKDLDVSMDTGFRRWHELPTQLHSFSTAAARAAGQRSSSGQAWSDSARASSAWPQPVCRHASWAWGRHPRRARCCRSRA